MDKPKHTAALSPAKAIRIYCLECCYESSNEVKLCQATTCPLYPFRFGKNPYNSRASAKTKAVLATDAV